MIIFKNRVNGDLTKTQRENIARALVNGFNQAMGELLMETSPCSASCLVTYCKDYCMFYVSIHTAYYNKHIGKLVPEQQFKEECNLVARAYDLAVEECDKVDS